MSETPKYPGVVVGLGDLWGEAGNAYLILGRIKEALTVAAQGGDCDHGAADAFFAEATTGDYDHLLATVDAYVDAFLVLTPSIGYPSIIPLSDFREQYANRQKEDSQ